MLDHTQVSIIVPTRNRRESVGRLLQSLAQTINPTNATVEIIVVDNASTDDTGYFLAETAKTYAGLRVLFEPKPGKNFALNRAIKAATGKFICFMDDDIVLNPTWLQGLLNDLDTLPYDALQPRVLPGLDPAGNTANRTLLYEYNVPVIDYGDSVRDINGMTGVFMCVRREVIDTIGGFDDRLPASGYHGDTDFSRRAREAGFLIGYTPHATAYHELNPNRYGVDYARLSQYRKGLSRSLYGRDSLILNVIPNLFANVLRYFAYRTFFRRDKVYKTEKRIMKYWGYLTGRFQRRLGRRPWV